MKRSVETENIINFNQKHFQVQSVLRTVLTNICLSILLKQEGAMSIYSIVI